MSLILCAKCGYTATANDIKIPISPVPNLLHGHYVASPSEAQLIHDTISTTRVHIAQLAGEMARLQGILDERARKQDALESYTEMHLSLVAPVRSLPAEILSEIFLCLKDATTLGEVVKWDAVSPRLNKTPLLLGSVCSRWRTVALSTPSLWASFALTIVRKRLERSIALAEMWLARAGACPLSISLSATRNYDPSMRSFMQVFLPYCEHWYEVRLDLATAFIDVWYPAKNRLPRLRTLFISARCGPSDVFTFAPQLRDLYLASPIPPSYIKLPWSQLQFCDMGVYRGVNGCLEMLRLAPNLEEFEVLWPYPNDESPHAPVLLSHMHRMVIHGNPVYLLNKLLLPELHELVLNDDHCLSWMANSQLALLLSRYPLELLSITGRNIDDADLIEILRSCPSLVHFEQRGDTPVMTKTFLSQFTYHRSSENSQMLPLAPRLRTMKVDYDPSTFDLSAFVDAIQSRMMLDGIGLDSDITSVAKLETVEIHVPTNYYNTEILRRLIQLRDAGLKISLLDSCGRDTLL